MTSPNPPELPYVTSGMIWDGVTEYHPETPLGVNAYLLHMVGDGSRRFTEYSGTGTPVMWYLNNRRDAGWEKIGVTFDSTNTFHNGGFLGYDGTLTHEPVNQHHLIKFFREHAARFAHQLDAAMGHHHALQRIRRRSPYRSSDALCNDRERGGPV